MPFSFSGSLFELHPLHRIKHTFFLHSQSSPPPRPCPCSMKMSAPSYPCQTWAVQAPCSLRCVSLSKFPKPFNLPPTNSTLKFLWCIWQAWRCRAAVVLRPWPTTETVIDALAPSALPSVCISCFLWKLAEHRPYLNLMVVKHLEEEGHVS